MTRASSAPTSNGRTASSVPWITSTGHAMRSQRRVNSAGSCSSAAEIGERERLRRRLQAPPDAVLDLLGRVRLGEHLPEEELEEVAVVLEPVVAVVLGPALVGLERLVERRRDARGVLGERGGGGDEHRGRDPLGMLGGEQHAPQRARRQPDHHGTLDARRVHDRQRVGGELPLGVGVDGLRPIRASVSTSVEREHARVAGEIRDLPLPVPRVDDRPGGQQQDRRLAAAVELPEDPDAVALDVALVIRIAGARLLRAARGRRHRRHARRLLAGALARSAPGAGGREAAPMRPRDATSSAGPRDPSALFDRDARDVGEGRADHWKISVVQSPPWRRTSWARAGPSGRSWKSTKKSGSTSIPPSGEQLTRISHERSPG